jgi:hypothetical protein
VPENEEELDLQEGDIVKVTEKHEDGWCVAVFNGKIGYVPANYLEEIVEPTPIQKQRPLKPAPPIPQKPKSDPVASNHTLLAKKESSPTITSMLFIQNTAILARKTNKKWT